MGQLEVNSSWNGGISSGGEYEDDAVGITELMETENRKIRGGVRNDFVTTGNHAKRGRDNIKLWDGGLRKRVQDEVESCSFVDAFFTYLCYPVLVIVGYFNDFIRPSTSQEKNRAGYNPLYVSFESFYTRHVYRRIGDACNIPICGIPGKYFTVKDRISFDHGWTFQFTREGVVYARPKTHLPWKKIFIVVEGVYSMEATIVKLPEILDLKRKYEAYLYLDEAHSIGAVGPHGRGVNKLMNLICVVDMQPGKKKRFIDKKKAVTFYLGHRSQKDQLIGYETAPQHVLIPMDQVPSTSGAGGSNQKNDTGERREEQIQYRIYYDSNEDEYSDTDDDDADSVVNLKGAQYTFKKMKKIEKPKQTCKTTKCWSLGWGILIIMLMLSVVSSLNALKDMDCESDANCFDCIFKGCVFVEFENKSQVCVQNSNTVRGIRRRQYSLNCPEDLQPKSVDEWLASKTQFLENKVYGYKVYVWLTIPILISFVIYVFYKLTRCYYHRTRLSPRSGWKVPECLRDDCVCSRRSRRERSPSMDMEDIHFESVSGSEGDAETTSRRRSSSLEPELRNSDLDETYAPSSINSSDTLTSPIAPSRFLRPRKLINYSED